MKSGEWEVHVVTVRSAYYKGKQIQAVLLSRTLGYNIGLSSPTVTTKSGNLKQSATMQTIAWMKIKKGTSFMLFCMLSIENQEAINSFAVLRTSESFF